MKLFFSRSNKLLEKVNLILIFLSLLIIAILIFIKGLGMALLYGFVNYVFFKIISSYIINVKDSKIYNNLLSILYELCDPSKFLNILNTEIDYSLLDKEQTTTLLIHRANALAFEGNFNSANDILDKLDSEIDQQDSDKLLIINNKLTISLIEKAFGDKAINENIFNYSIRKLEEDGSPYLNNSIQDKIIYKIINSEKLNETEENDLWLFIMHSGSKLNIETLYYFASIHLFNEGDIEGAIEELKQINLDSRNTVIQRGALNYLNEINKIVE